MNIWGYASLKPEFMKPVTTETVIVFYRRGCNIAILSALLSFGLSFFFPLTAFLMLVARVPFILSAKRLFKLLRLKNHE